MLRAREEIAAKVDVLFHFKAAVVKGAVDPGRIDTEKSRHRRDRVTVGLIASPQPTETDTDRVATTQCQDDLGRKGRAATRIEAFLIETLGDRLVTQTLLCEFLNPGDDLLFHRAASASRYRQPSIFFAYQTATPDDSDLHHAILVAEQIHPSHQGAQHAFLRLGRQLRPDLGQASADIGECGTHFRRNRHRLRRSGRVQSP
jgi:hypothetical protein